MPTNNQPLSHNKLGVRSAWLGAVLSGLSVSAHAQETKCRVEIPVESLSTEIVAFNRQCKIQALLLSEGNELEGVKGNPVVGDFEPAEALRRILDHTGWIFSSIVDDKVSIVRDKRPVPQALADVPVAHPHLPSKDALALGAPGESAPRPSLPLDQVVVTGTLIRGVDAISSPLITLAAGQIPDTGYAGAQSMLDASLPIASNNTPREDYTALAGNFGFGLGINLRDLGVGATLVLVDGRRQPRAGLYGAFVDVSAVPSAAIDRIEVIPDGASALYGSDAIAGVVNIILRHDFVGAETSARYALGKGGGEEALVSQVFGSKWDGGHAMLLYQYTDRTSVPIASRSYAANPDRRPQGGDDFRSIDANPGNILDPATYLPAYAIPPGQNGRTLSVSQLLSEQVNSQSPLLGTDLYPQRTTHSFYVTVEQEVASGIRLFFDGRLNRRDGTLQDEAVAETLTVPASNAFYVNPFSQSPFVLVPYSFFDDLGNRHQVTQTVTATASVGLKADLGNGWRTTFSLTEGIEDMNVRVYNNVNPTALSTALSDSASATAFNPFGAGANTPTSTLDEIRAVQGDQALSRVPELSALADGPLFEWQGISAKLALGSDLRQESLQQHQSLTDYVDVHTAYKREIGSIFGELVLSLPGHVDLSLAGRYEHYSDFGSTTNPKVGIRWSPWNSVKLRASWGTSFRAPELPDLDTSRNSSGLVHLPDPKSPTGQSVVLYEEGNSPKLHEETAATWTLGLDLAPSSIPGLQTSLTYYSIDYRDRIAQPGPANIFNILVDEAVWGEVIQRNPAPATATAICNGPRFFGTPSDCLSTPPAAIVDIRQRNLSRTLAKGIDLSLEQSFDNSLGFFRWSARGAYVLTFGQAVTDSAPVTSVANTLSYPIKVKARATLSWSERRATLPGLSFALAANFAGAYRDNESGTNRRIASYSTIDAQLGYLIGEGRRWFENTDITLSATNLLDTQPPFVNTLYGFDQPNTPPVARLVTVSLRKKW
jgi:iron complex outermembrane recepter protein